LFDLFKPSGPEQTLPELLQEKRQISADQINQVIFRYFYPSAANRSHIHWDHCSPFSSYLPKATALFGPGTIAFSNPGWSTDPDSALFSELIDPNHSWSDNVEELPNCDDPRWKPFGTFERAWDLWGDGSLWLIDAPGHVAGNMAAAARLQDGKWIVMGGDCAHSRYEARLRS